MDFGRRFRGSRKKKHVESQAYEVAMNVWGISFIEIETQWTDDQFYMMFERLGDRLNEEKKAHSKASRGGSSGSPQRGGSVQTSTLSTKEFLSKIGKPVKSEGAHNGD